MKKLLLIVVLAFLLLGCEKESEAQGRLLCEEEWIGWVVEQDHGDSYTLKYKCNFKTVPVSQRIRVKYDIGDTIGKLPLSDKSHMEQLRNLEYFINIDKTEQIRDSIISELF